MSPTVFPFDGRKKSGQEVSSCGGGHELVTCRTTPEDVVWSFMLIVRRKKRLSGRTSGFAKDFLSGTKDVISISHPETHLSQGPVLCV